MRIILLFPGALSNILKIARVRGERFLSFSSFFIASFGRRTGWGLLRGRLRLLTIVRAISYGHRKLPRILGIHERNHLVNLLGRKHVVVGGCLLFLGASDLATGSARILRRRDWLWVEVLKLRGRIGRHLRGSL